jgi:hypothetical protein
MRYLAYQKHLWIHLPGCRPFIRMILATRFGATLKLSDRAQQYSPNLPQLSSALEVRWRRAAGSSFIHCLFRSSPEDYVDGMGQVPKNRTG